MIDKRQLGNVDYFSYFGSLIRNYASCIREINPGLPWQDQISRERNSFHEQNLACNPLNAELNPICHLLALLGAHHIFHVSGLRVKLTF